MVELDAVAYGLTPYGGLITYWDAVLPRLDREVNLRIRALGRVRASLPVRADQVRVPWTPQVFLSTYYSLAPPMVPSVVVVHDTILEDGLLDAVEAGDPLKVGDKRACISAAERIVVPSRATLASLERHYPGLRPRVDVVPYGVDAVFARRPPRWATSAAVSLLRSHGVQGPFVLHVGGRGQYKDFSILIAAMNHLRRSHPEVRLVAVGSETELRAEERDEPGADAIILLGYVPRDVLAALYRLASVVATASRAEGFGLPIAEAGAAGTPVVCSDLPVFREVAVSGTRFFPAGDRCAAAAALRAALASCRSPGLPRRPVRGWDEAASGLLAALAAAAAGPQEQPHASVGMTSRGSGQPGPS